MRIRYSIKPPEQMIVKENRRHQRAIFVARILIYVSSIKRNFARIRRVKAGKHSQKRRFARAIAACDENKLARPQSKIDRANLEGGLGKSVDVTEHDLAHLDLAETLRDLKLAWLAGGNGRPHGGFKLHQPVRRCVCIQQNR